MFTPQRKTPYTPPPSVARTTRLTAEQKGKSIAFPSSVAAAAAEPPSPPPPLTRLFDCETVRPRGDNAGDWKRFREAGLLDMAPLEVKDRQALLDRVSKLEKELFEYQHNMGLLLLEKMDLVSKNEEVGHKFAEAQEILKREKTAHLIAISEAEQREENLKKALSVEKKSLADLERALRDMHEEYAKFKASSETSVADVNIRMETLETKRLELEAKTHVADAKLATSDRKNSELDRKLQDLESRERILQRERQSLAAEKEAHQAYFQKHKKDLIEWERKLQEGEQKLCESRRVLKEREEKLNDFDRSSKEKETYMDELQQKIDSADATLKNMKVDMEIKLADLDSKEKKSEAMRHELVMKERELLEKEESLNARESVELENLLNKHKSELDAKMVEFELERKQKRNSMEEELHTRMQEVDARRSEINHLAEMLGKREQALEKKSERVKEKEKDVDGKTKVLKEREKSLKAEEKNLELKKKEIDADKEGLNDFKKELEIWKTNLRKQEVQIEEDRKELEVLQEETSNYLRLQTNLKQEIEIARRQGELIEKEAMDLKLEREKFEKEWEVLDEKRAAMDNKLKILAEERASFEKLQNSEEERLKRELAEREENLKLESERIRLEKESFEAAMEHEKKMYNEKAQKDHSLMLRDLECEREKFSKDLEKSQNNLQEMMEEKERAFEERKLKEIGNLSHLKEVAEREKKDMEIQRHRLEKEREEMELIKKQLEKTRVEMSTDVLALGNLSKTLKKQREEFACERRPFLAFIEQIKGCSNCGDSVQAFIHHDLQLPALDGPCHSPRSFRDDDSDANGEPTPTALNKINLKSGGQMSVLQKCASIIFKSPKSRSQPTDDRITEKSPSCADYVLDEGKIKQNSSIDDCRRSLVDASLKNSASVREVSIDTAPSVDVSNIASSEQGGESENTISKNSKRKPGRKRGPGVQRTHSVKAVVEDAKAILGEGFDKKVEIESDEIDVGARKRSRSQASRVTESEQDVDYSEGIADSATTGGRRKRRQISAAAVQTPGQRRYNLRRHTAVETTTAEQTASENPKNEDDAASKDTGHIVQNPPDIPAPSLDAAVDSSSRLNLVQVSTTRSIEISSDRIVRFSPADHADNHLDADKSLQSTSVVEEAKSGENKLMNEEVHENEDDQDDDGGVSDGGVDEGEDEDGDRDGHDSDGHPGQASIGKKLWNFFTT